MEIRTADRITLVANGLETSGAASQITAADVSASQRVEQGRLILRVCGGQTPVEHVRLRWNFAPEERFREPVRILGDAWERSYGDLEWRGIVPDRCMPWVAAASNGSDGVSDLSGRWTQCWGVAVQPSAFCMWQVDGQGVTLHVDLRCGGEGVLLNGRTLTACEVLFARYEHMRAFDALKAFYRLLSPNPLNAGNPVYGSNNWYYAYRQSSEGEILGDTDLLASMTQGLENRPFMVIDDGWQPNPCDGPWACGNERFADMRALADEIRARGARPGLWVRYLSDAHRMCADVTEEMRLARNPDFLDPSHPAVLEKVARETRRFADEWGFELIKHDFSTFDLFGFWGFERSGLLAEDGWHFYDRTRTSAEIVKDFYRTILDAAGGRALILGCNVIGHLAAGLAHANRIGDDTSGLAWERTRKMGVNTLAFRLAQHGALFQVDADCVGITGKIDWEMNRRWLKLLAVSGTPLFVSCKPSEAQGRVSADLRDAYARASAQRDALIPLDWMENNCPERWLLNGEEIRFEWIEDGGIREKVL